MARRVRTKAMRRWDASDRLHRLREYRRLRAQLRREWREHDDDLSTDVYHNPS